MNEFKNVNSNKNIVVTSALPYANSEPHIGHLRSTYLPADIMARYLKAKGYKAYHVSGTDEHGTPILARALREKRNPREIVDYYHEVIKRAFERAGVHFDIFSRTTKPHHYELTLKFFEKAKKAGYIYKKEIKILYCEHDKLALPDRLVIGTCPYCGAPNQYGDYCEVCGRTYTPLQLKNPRCAICGNPPVIKTSTHYFFALSEFSDRLERWIKEKVKLTKGVKEQVLHWIKSGLQDWDITRNIPWGVPVPDLPDQVFYVWWDAPIGYISFTKELFDSIGEDWEAVWVRGEGYIIHFIGKDIIYHHVLFWPAMLMAVDFALPNEIRVRGFATLEKEKMSKSRGHYIGLEEFLDIWPADYLRFYWAITTSESLTDGDFSLYEYSERINKSLIGEFGNLVHRVLTLIKRGNITDGDIIKSYIENAEKLFVEYDELMISNQFDQGLEKSLEISRLGNKLLSEKEPWRKLESKEAADTLITALGISAIAAVSLEPYIPYSIEKFKEYVGLKVSSTEFRKTIEKIFEDGTDVLISMAKNVISQKEIRPIFAKVTNKQIESVRKTLKARRRK